MKKKIFTVLSFILLCICTPMISLASESNIVQLEVENVEADAGTTQKVDVSIKNNPGILGCKLTVKYDSRLVLKSANAGEAFAALTLTKPGVLENSCNFVWDAIELSPENIKDGVILTLTFDVPADIKDNENLEVEVVCEDAVNKDLSAVSVVNGTGEIIVKNRDTVGKLDNITVNKKKTSYNVGDTINIDDIAVIAEYSDGTKKNVSNYTTNVDSIDMKTVGRKILTVAYTDGGITKKASIELEVKAAESVNNTKLIVGNNLSLPGDYIDVDILVANNPGILGMTLTLQYDSKLTLISAKSGDAFDMLAMTKPGVFESGCKFVWDGTELDDKSIKDGTILTLTFEISKEVKAGEKYIISASSEDAVDMNLNPVKITTQSGSLSIGDDSSIVDNKLIGLTATKKNVRYEVGSILDLDDLVVQAEYNGGLYKNVEDFTTNADEIDMNVVGDKTLIVKYSDQEIIKTAEIIINVVDKRENHVNHTSYTLVKEIPASCVKEGVKAYYKCDSCDRIFEDKNGTRELENPIKIPKTNHDYKHIILKATLTQNGYDIQKCSKCNTELDRETIYSPKTIILSQSSFVYTGKNQIPTVVVKDVTGNIIEKSNYHIVYNTDSRKIGSYKVNIVFKNKYSGSLSKNYKIVPKTTKITKLVNNANGIKITWAKKKYDGYKIYRSVNGGKYKSIKTINNPLTTSWIDLTAKNNGKQYSYKVYPYKTVTGIVYKSVSPKSKKCIYIAKEKIVSVDSPSTGMIQIKWAKNKFATGYQIQYSTKKSFASPITKYYKNNNIKTGSLKNLKKGATYYIRVRAYQKGTTKQYGPWSSIKKIKVLK